MQTVLQELISELKSIESYDSIVHGIIKRAESKLEKEKEQIVNAYDRGYKACDLDEALEINKTMFSGEGYYEQTYKPETI